MPVFEELTRDTHTFKRRVGGMPKTVSPPWCRHCYPCAGIVVVVHYLWAQLFGAMTCEWRHQGLGGVVLIGAARCIVRHGPEHGHLLQHMAQST